MHWFKAGYNDKILRQIVDETYWALCEGGLHSSRWNGSFITFTATIMMMIFICILINMSIILIISLTPRHNFSVTKGTYHLSQRSIQRHWKNLPVKKFKWGLNSINHLGKLPAISNFLSFVRRNLPIFPNLCCFQLSLSPM